MDELDDLKSFWKRDDEIIHVNRDELAELARGKTRNAVNSIKKGLAFEFWVCLFTLIITPVVAYHDPKPSIVISTVTAEAAMICYMVYYYFFSKRIKALEHENFTNDTVSKLAQKRFEALQKIIRGYLIGSLGMIIPVVPAAFIIGFDSVHEAGFIQFFTGELNAPGKIWVFILSAAGLYIGSILFVFIDFKYRYRRPLMRLKEGLNELQELKRLN